MKLLDLVHQSTERVEKNNHVFYHQIDNFKFDNKHLVNWYEKQFDTQAIFVHREFDNIKSICENTAIDLNRNYNIEFLSRLKSTFDSVKLFYSGGSDSTTILHEASKINFVFDETLTLIVENVDLPCNREIQKFAIPSLQKYKKNIQKAKFVVNTFDNITDYFADQYAFFSGPGDPMSPIGFGASKYQVLNPYLQSTNTCIIKGCDKPQLVFYKGKWFATVIDLDIDGDQSITNIVYFWLSADNILSYIKDAILYRNYIVENNFVHPGKSVQFFKPDSNPVTNEVINRVQVCDFSVQFEKTVSKLTPKYKQRLTDALELDRYDLLINYWQAAKKFNKIFPETCSQKGLEQYHQQGKFAWFIDIDTMQVFTQDELIPSGFETC